MLQGYYVTVAVHHTLVYTNYELGGQGGHMWSAPNGISSLVLFLGFCFVCSPCRYLDFLACDSVDTDWRG